jgi:hypothetical protein
MIRQLIFKQHAVEEQSAAVVAIRKRELAVERLPVHANAHGGNLQHQSTADSIT